MIKKHFDRLGVSRNASKNQIKKAYRKKAMLFHPDRNNHPAAEQKFIALNLSYEILMDYKEGGAPTYQTTTNSKDYKKTTYYQNTRFTIAEMEAAWARQRERERREYEEYLNLPWWSGKKLFEWFLKSFSIIIVLLLGLPLLIGGLVLMITGHPIAIGVGLFLVLFTCGCVYQLYNALTK